MRIFLLYTGYLLGLAGLGACKNYLGNPHAKAVAPRLASTQPADLQIDPPSWQLHGRRETVNLRLCSPGIEACQVQLGAVEKVKLIQTETTAPGCLTLTLALRKRTPAQKVPIFLTQGRRTITGEWRLLPKPE